MKQQQVIYASAIMVLAFIQLLPCLLVLCGSVIGTGIGCLYILALGYFWRSTIKGKWFFRELYRSALRLENLLFPMPNEE